jgi:dihydroxy-acid dehydratase
VVAASGGSTNAALHLPAIAHECGIAFDLFDVAEIFRRTPYIADLKPAGKYVAKDLFEAGGIPLLMKTLLDHGFLHGDCLTVTGRTIADNLRSVAWNDEQDVVHPADRPLSPTGGVVGLKGNLAPDGAIVKVAGMKNLKFTGPARCFDSEEACFEAVTKRRYQEGEVLVIRYEGPRGGPGMREMLATTAALYGQGMGDKVALITDGRFSVHLSDRELAERQKHWQPRDHGYGSGAIWKFARDVGPARYGAVTHPGGQGESVCYADI